MKDRQKALASIKDDPYYIERLYESPLLDDKDFLLDACKAALFI